MMDINDHDIRTAFDCEGTLSPAKLPRKTTWTLRISNTDLHWLELLQTYLVEKGYHPKIRSFERPDKPKWVTGYTLRIERVAEMARFITEFPPLTTRRQKRAAEFRVWLHRPKFLRNRFTSPATINAVEQMLKHSRRLI